MPTPHTHAAVAVPCFLPQTRSLALALLLLAPLADQAGAASRTGDPRSPRSRTPVPATVELSGRIAPATGQPSLVAPPGTCSWDGGFGLAGLDGPVRTSAVFDDGSGPALYVGGQFSTADGKEVNSIARWDGQGWQPLGGVGAPGVRSFGSTGNVFALTVHDDGSGSALYVGGAFQSAGGLDAPYLARWDGTSWSAVKGPGGEAPTNSIQALASFQDGGGPALYAAGAFRQVGGTVVNRVARWDGTQWSPLTGAAGTGLTFSSGNVARGWALQVVDLPGVGKALAVGGQFDRAGGLEANNVALWTGSNWVALGTGAGNGVDSTVRTFSSGSEAGKQVLYVGGDFATAGGKVAGRLARWNGTTWSAVSAGGGVGADGTVLDLDVTDLGGGPVLHATGDFRTIDGITVNGVARWTGSQWAPLPAADGAAPGLGPWGSGATLIGHAPAGSATQLWVGGTFGRAGGLATHHLAIWNGTAWGTPHPLDGDGLPNFSSALGSFDGRLYAAPPGGAVGEGIDAPALVRWDGAVWTAATPAPPRATLVETLRTLDEGSGPTLHVGGLFPRSDGSGNDGVFRLNGESWSALGAAGGSGFDNGVTALATFDAGSGTDLYAGGYFESVDGVSIGYLARWTGSAWSPVEDSLGAGLQDYVWALATFDDGSGSALYAASAYILPGSEVYQAVVRWNGASWSTLGLPGSALEGGAYSLATGSSDGSSPALYVGGEGLTLAGQDLLVARWDGATWSALPGLYATADSAAAVWALTFFDDGGGSRLYAGGAFALTPEGPNVGVARWNGSTWEALSGPRGDGISGAVDELAVFDDGTGPALYASGLFGFAGGVPSANIARWDCRPSVLLQEGRFRVRELFYDRATPRKVYNARFDPDLGDASWVASAFNPSNKEQLGKVLDGCGINQHYWLFYGTASNTEHYLVAEDLATGRKRTYHNADGALAKTVLDTTAFTCDDELPPGAEVIELADLDNAGSFTVTETAGTAGPCVPSLTSKCLLGGRFEVRGEASNFQVPPATFDTKFDIDLGTQSFLAYFFAEGNYEQLGKMLDGCSLNGNYWLLATTVSSVELELSVRRTADGLTRTYRKAKGTVAGALTDTSAFPCP